MSSWTPEDLAGNVVVEEQIRQYYVKKKSKELKVIFTEGIATEPKTRVEFTIDNSDMQKVIESDMELHNRINSTAWSKFYKGNKAREAYETQ